MSCLNIPTLMQSCCLRRRFSLIPLGIHLSPCPVTKYHLLILTIFVEPSLIFSLLISKVVLGECFESFQKLLVQWGCRVSSWENGRICNHQVVEIVQGADLVLSWFCFLVWVRELITVWLLQLWILHLVHYCCWTCWRLRKLVKRLIHLVADIYSCTVFFVPWLCVWNGGCRTLFWSQICREWTAYSLCEKLKVL